MSSIEKWIEKFKEESSGVYLIHLNEEGMCDFFLQTFNAKEYK